MNNVIKVNFLISKIKLWSKKKKINIILLIQMSRYYKMFKITEVAEVEACSKG